MEYTTYYYLCNIGYLNLLRICKIDLIKHPPYRILAGDYSNKSLRGSAMPVANTQKMLVVFIVIMDPLTFLQENYFTNIAQNQYFD